MDTEVKKEEEVQTYKRTYLIPGPYLGLQNIGATCYMNSVLQTLFMTPEFRRGLFQWKFTDDQNDKDSIPFQLQRIFGRLQTKVFEYLDTRDLIKSFQWNVNQAFEQHDIQEFIRVLFDAIEQSLSPDETNFVKELYEGVTLNYTKCLKCGYESSRQENFLDYQLLVKNKYQKIYNESLEKAMQVTMKPEMLTQGNQYFCEVCQEKVDAQRGTKFLKVPTLLCLHVQRFTFDYMTMKRQKLDDYMSFPFVLNMNNYINGYEGIPNKLSEESDPSIWEDNLRKPVTKTVTKSTTTTIPKPPSSLPFPPVPPPLATKKSGKAGKATSASSQTRSFLEDVKKRKKEMMGEQQTVIEIYESVDSQTQAAIEKSLEQQPNPEATKNDEPAQIQQEPAPEQNTQMQVEPAPLTLPPPPPPPPPPPITTAPVSQNDEAILNKQRNKAEQFEPEVVNREINMEEDRKLYYAHVNDRCQQHHVECDKQIMEALKDGEYVYQLYSILNHQGGAFGGHYFAFIRSFEDGRWYCFNDGNVTGVDPTDIPKRAFGGAQNNSAYMLFYRKVDQGQESYKTWGGAFSEEDLPPKVLASVEEERKKLSEYLEQGGSVEGLAHSVRSLTLKVFFKLEYKLIQAQSVDNYETFQNAAFAAFDIKDTQNCRVRGYVAHADLLTDTYTGKERLTLNELKIQTYKTFSFEFRSNPSEEWKQYDQSTLNIRYTMWNDKLEAADENQLEKHKVAAKKQWKISEVAAHICQTLGMVGTRLLISRRVQDYGLDIAKPLDEQKSLEELDIQEQWVLYAEPWAEQSCWARQFDIDAHTVTIRFNHPDGVVPEVSKVGHLECQPNDEFPYITSVDNRNTLYELKQKMCQQLDLDVMDVIIRRGGRAGLEIKDLKPVIELSHFVRGSSIFLERGCPLNQGEYRAIVCLCEPNPDILEDRNLYLFQEIGEYPVHGDKLLSTFKKDIFEWASKKTKTQLNPSEYRLRERISDRLTKVYRDLPLKAQGILEKRMIALERLPPSHTEWITPRDVQILVRFWDQTNYTLSERYELIVQRNDSTLDLAQRFHEFFPHVQPENMEVCRIVALYRFNRYDLFAEELQWFSLNSDEFLLGSQPLFLTNDGQMLIVRDITQEPRELTEEEQKQFGIIQSQYAQKRSQYKAHPRINMPYLPAPQEKALTITVKRQKLQLTQYFRKVVQSEQAPESQQPVPMEVEATKQPMEEESQHDVVNP